MNTPVPEETRMEDPHILIEKALVEEYLREQGYSLAQLKDLPDEQANHLMIEASKYASLKLEEIESRAHFIETLHHSNPT